MAQIAMADPKQAGDSSPAPTGGRSALCRGSRITGDLEFPGLVEVLGQIRGTIVAESIMVGESGETEGALTARSIAVRGRVKGDLAGDSVTLHTGARVSGTISYRTLVIESGAEVEARVKRRG